MRQGDPSGTEAKGHFHPTVRLSASRSCLKHGHETVAKMPEPTL